MLQMFSAFAEFERNRIRERTQEGLNRAKAEGLSQSATAKELSIGIATVKRQWNK